MSNEMLEQYYRNILSEVGEDPDREGLVRTPVRAAQAMRFFTQGYNETVEHLLNKAVFTEDYKDLILVKNIEFYSLCEHHLVPFFGEAHIAYIPNGKVIGLSKIARLVDMFARRLQVQERMTDQIGHALQEAIKPKGVAVIIEARHLCMMMRGVNKQNSKMTTSHVSGEFHEDAKTRAELFNLLGVSPTGISR